jgi:hypothetical protein
MLAVQEELPGMAYQENWDCVQEDGGALFVGGWRSGLGELFSQAGRHCG